MGQVAEKAYTFRPYIESDIPFIQSSWGHSYYDGVNGHLQLSPEEFHAYHRPIRERALANPNSAAIMCVSSNDPDTILGWILVEKAPKAYFIKCHFIYVKASVSGNGIAKELAKIALPIRPVLYTHSTIKSRRIIKENWRAGKSDFERWLPCPHLV